MNKTHRPHMICIRMSDVEYKKLTERISGEDPVLSRSEWIRGRIFAPREELILKSIFTEIKKLRIETYYLQQRLADHPIESDEAMQLMDRCGQTLADLDRYLEAHYGDNKTGTHKGE